jgi:hypothetical protein
MSENFDEASAGLAEQHSFAARARLILPGAGVLTVLVAIGLGVAKAQQTTAYSTALDQPIALLGQTRAELGRIADYECTLVKVERVEGKLLPEQVITMRARMRPYSVYLRFESPGSMRGQEVCYVAGRNKGLMRVHPAGWRRIVGFVSLDIHDSRAFEDNRHVITEAAIWPIMDATARYWEMERRVNKTAVRIEDRQFRGRPCTWIETTHPDRAAAAFYAYRCVLCIDKESHLPVRIEAYDWPRPNGPPEGDLLECYSYLNWRTNIGLSDKAFDY